MRLREERDKQIEIEEEGNIETHWDRGEREYMRCSSAQFDWQRHCQEKVMYLVSSIRIIDGRASGGSCRCLPRDVPRLQQGLGKRKQGLGSWGNGCWCWWRPFECVCPRLVFHLARERGKGATGEARQAKAEVIDRRPCQQLLLLLEQTTSNRRRRRHLFVLDT